MQIVLYVISILWIALGTFLIIHTVRTREFLEKMIPREQLRWLAPVPIAFGIALVAGAFYQKGMFWVPFILGVLALLKGVYLSVGPSNQIKGLLEWWFHKASEGTIRLHGLIVFFLGTAILSYL